MLGAIKGEAQSQESLFRQLSRRWAPLVPLKRSTSPLSLAEQPAPARAWIGVKRRRYLPPAPAPKSGPTWNPWMWMK